MSYGSYKSSGSVSEGSGSTGSSGSSDSGCPPLPSTMYYGVSHSADGEPGGLSGADLTEWFPASYLRCFNYSAMVLSGATGDNEATIAGVAIDSAGGDIYKTSTLDADTPASLTAETSEDGTMFRLVISYSSTNYASGGPDWYNPTAVNGVVRVTWSLK